MNKQTLSVFFQVAVIAAILLVFNFLVYYMPDLKGKTADFVYPLPVMYGFFFLMTAAVLAVLMKINRKNQEQTGYAFLFLTTAKIALSYVIVRPILNKAGENPTEKVNFFVIFILFLAIEAYYTARLLNNK
ncbi:hypothetical protein [Flavobacterium suzhouense]|uniref:ATP synthase protein I n=1 Tax=Flavobacterium suzhouense TaxID=1529638 RepID=A0ABW5NUJ6_9FLAO